MDYVIIGNGVAGIDAAISIRKFDEDGTITLISASAHSFYYRPRLTEFLKGSLSESSMIIHKPDFYKERSIDELLATTVTAIRPESHEIDIVPASELMVSSVTTTAPTFIPPPIIAPTTTIPSGTSSSDPRPSLSDPPSPSSPSSPVSPPVPRTISYDKLLLATGSRSFRPPIPGINDQCVFSLRTIADANAIIQCAQKIDSITIIGGGLLGLEIGHYLRQIGKDITILENSERLLPNQLDTDGAEVLQHVLEEKKGLKFQLSENITGITPSSADGIPIPRENTVVCSSGRELITDMVIIATGIRSRTELAKDSGLNVNRGVVVNDFLQSSDPDIYAAGDTCEHGGRMYGIWPVAQVQGRVAGQNMTGIREEYTGSVPSTTLKVPGINLFSAGDFNSTDGEVHVHRDEYRYRKLIVKNGQPVGVIALGDPGAMVAAMRTIDGKAPLELLLKHF